MNRTSIFLLLVCFVFGITLAVAFVVPYAVTFEEREGARPRDGITVVRSEHIEIDSLEFYFIATLDPNLIEVRLNTLPDQEFLFEQGYEALLKPGIIGIYFPYDVTLDTDYNPASIDFSTWYSEPNGNGVVFVKQIPCQSKSDCYLSENDQVRFIMEPGTKFDSQSIYRHSVKIKFDHPGGKAIDVFGKFDSGTLVYGFINFTNAHATIIVPETANHINTLPNPEPGMFHNSGNDYSNTQLDWPLGKNEHTFFVDYEMPDERKEFEQSQVTITIVGIVLGSSVGVVSILYAKIQENKRRLAEREKIGKIQSIIKWTLGYIQDELETLASNPPKTTELKSNLFWTKTGEHVKILRALAIPVAKDLDENLGERLIKYIVFFERCFEQAIEGKNISFSYLNRLTKAIAEKFFPEFEQEKKDASVAEQKYWEQQVEEVKRQSDEYWEQYYTAEKIDEILAEQALDEMNDDLQDEDETKDSK